MDGIDYIKKNLKNDPSYYNASIRRFYDDWHHRASPLDKGDYVELVAIIIIVAVIAGIVLIDIIKQFN